MDDLLIKPDDDEPEGPNKMNSPIHSAVVAPHWDQFKHPVDDVTIIQQNYVILRIIGNFTAHCFPMHSLVITAYSAVDNCDTMHTYAFSPVQRSGQYLSKDCVAYVTALRGPVTQSYAVYMKVLNEFIAGVVQSQGLTNFYNTVAKTQKARGLQTLSALRLLESHVALIRKPLTKTDKETLSFPIMVRPCPVKPRHGFVDSRVVKSILGINRVLEETLKADPKGEVILMTPIQSEFSAIVTDSAVTLGPGTDGATSGKNCIVIPCITNLRNTLRAHGQFIYRSNKLGVVQRLDVLRYAGVTKDAGIFIETVGDQVVQLRTGPTTDFGAARYMGRPVVTPNMVYTVDNFVDFLAFEARLDHYAEMYADAPWDVVVYHPGAGLSSHYAVQAITRGFSVFTDIKPVIGHSYVSASFNKNYIAPSSVFRKQVIQAMAVGYETIPTAQTLQWAIAIIQGLAAAERTVPSAGLVIAASVVIAKAGVALCLGEHRHFFRSGPGRHGHVALAPVSFPLELSMHYKKGNLGRSQVYHEAFKLPWNQLSTWQQMLSLMACVEVDYRNDDWSPGYGGYKWAECTKATFEIIKALLPFVLTTPTAPVMAGSPDTTIDTQINQLIGACNRLITLSHNSAKCLTKIIHRDALKAITNGSTGLTIARSPFTWNVVK